MTAKGQAYKMKVKAAHREVCDAIIKKIEKGERIWSPSWEGAPSILGLPIRASTGSKKTPYRGINVWWLMNVKFERNYESDEWGTVKHWMAESNKHAIKNGEFEVAEKKDGTTFKKATSYYGIKGEWSGEATPIVFMEMKTYKDKKTNKDTGEEEETTGRYFMRRAFWVYNRDQTKLPKVKPKKQTSKQKDRAVINAEKRIDLIIKSHGINYQQGGNRAYYNYATDYIATPEREHFKTLEGRCAVLLHELTHWTGHPTRLDRKIKNKFGNEDYAHEELVAEMGAAMMCSASGISDSMIDEQLEDHAAYLRNWLSHIKKAKDGGQRFIFQACSQAQRACDLLMPEEFGVETDE